MKINERMSPRERLLLFNTLELLRKEIGPKFADWKDADDWLRAQLDFPKDELRQVYEGRNVAYYDGSAIEFEAAKKKRFDDMFIFDDEIHVNDYFTGVNGYLWATEGLIDKLKMEVYPAKIDHEENINFYADYNVVDKKLELSSTYFEAVENAMQQLVVIPLDEEEKEALLERFEAYSLSHGRELSLFDFVNEARGDYDMELLEKQEIPHVRSLDEIAEDMVESIRGFGVDQGSGYYEIKTFEVDGEEFELVAEAFMDKNEETKKPYYGVYWYVGFYDGDTLFSDYFYTKEELSLDEVKTFVKGLYEKDFTDDVKKELDQEELSDNMLLAKEEYEHYKDTWRKAHGVTDEMVAEMKEQYRQNVFEGEFEGSFEEYEQEFGYYGGNIYVCFNEFLENEFEEIKGERFAVANNNIVKQMNGLELEGYCPETHKAMTVSIVFSHADIACDNTELSISSFNKQELSELFESFCEENHFKDVHIQSLDIVRTSRTLDELIAIEEGFSSLEDKMAEAESMKRPKSKRDYKEKAEFERE